MNYQITEVNKYVAQINRIPMLTKEKEKELLVKYYKTKDKSLANTIITSNLRFVVSVAHSYRGYGHPLADLIQEGNKAMMRALEKFDPNKDIRFCSYAVYWIKAYMGNYVMKNHSIVKFGSTRAQKEFFYKLKKAREVLEKEECQNLTESLATYFNVSEQEILHNLNRLNIKDCSLNTKIGNNTKDVFNLVKGDFLISPNDSQEVYLEAKEKTDAIKKVMKSIQKSLNSREKFIVEHRLSSDEPMTLQEIGAHFGISRERARQIESMLILKLQTALEEFKEG